MAPPSLPQPLDRLPDDRIPGLPRPALTAAAEGAHRPSDVTGAPLPPGGERLGRLPGPQGLDRFASGDRSAAARSRVFDLAPTPRAVGNARRSVGELLGTWGVCDEARDNAVLVTSELVTNAIVHSAGRRIVCRVHATDDRVRIEVEDQNGGFTLPAPRRARPDEQNGRGLFLVDALSLDWGVQVAPEGSTARVVWAELPTAPDDCSTTPHAPGDPSPHGPSPHS
ncbi:ATP-binding protein [Streptomyces humi]